MVEIGNMSPVRIAKIDVSKDFITIKKSSIIMLFVQDKKNR